MAIGENPNSPESLTLEQLRVRSYLRAKFSGANDYVIYMATLELAKSDIEPVSGHSDDSGLPHPINTGGVRKLTIEEVHELIERQRAA